MLAAADAWRHVRDRRPTRGSVHLPIGRKMEQFVKDTYLNCAQLLSPSLGRLDFLHSTKLIRSIARDANVVVAFKDNLQVTDIKLRGLAQFGELAGAADDLVDEIIGYLEKCLQKCVRYRPERKLARVDRCSRET